MLNETKIRSFRDDSRFWRVSWKLNCTEKPSLTIVCYTCVHVPWLNACIFVSINCCIHTRARIAGYTRNGYNSWTLAWHYRLNRENRIGIIWTTMDSRSLNSYEIQTPIEASRFPRVWRGFWDSYKSDSNNKRSVPG